MFLLVVQIYVNQNFYFLAVHTAAVVNNKKPPEPKKVSSCWNPAGGTQISCPSKTSFCQVNKDLR